jgi:hypothetical protein
MTNYPTHHRHCSPPITLPSIANNINASTASATTTLLVDNSSGSSTNENSINRTFMNTVSHVPENCFEPETYRNLYPLNSNQQKKLSFSDPTLNQTTKLSRRSQQQQQTILNSTTTDEYFSASSLPQKISKEEEHTQIKSDDDDYDDDEIETLSSYEETLLKEKTATINTSRKVSTIENVNKQSEMKA